MKTIKAVLILGVVFFGYSAFAVDPVISEVTVRQRWPWSKLVDINYVLTCDDTVDIIISGFNGEKALSIPSLSFSGDISGVSSGTRRIVWDPTATEYADMGVLSQFRVALEAVPVPLYMIVDLTKSAGEDGQIDYVFESDLRAGIWGSWVEDPVTNRGTVIASVVWTGVTNDLVYATDKLILRRVPVTGAFQMGTAGVLTTLTKAYYAGVFEVTEAQWAKIMGGGDTSSKPKGTVGYTNIRGATTDVPAVNWPTTDWPVVTPSSFLGKLRLKTGLNDFDLPTEAQWEHLCRAGTTTLFNDGKAAANVTGANALTNAWLDVLGWYEANCGPGNTHPVGQKLSNAWGLYDTHGNVWEWCLDWYSTAAFASGIDPKGPFLSPESPVQRVGRGAGYNTKASGVLSTSRAKFNPLWSYAHCGFRLVRTLP